MKLYLSTTSPYSRLALIAALHSGKRDLQLHYVLPWENPAELIAINPYSQIPALLCDDGNILSETLIIMNYLDARRLYLRPCRLRHRHHQPGGARLCAQHAPTGAQHPASAHCA